MDLYRNLEADLQMSCLSQMSMIVIFMPCINKSLLGKRLASICLMVFFFGIFLAHFQDFMNKMEWFKKAETEDLVKGLDEFAHKLDVVVAVIWC